MVKIGKLYEVIRVQKADIATLTTNMQQITGDATTAWEDQVLSELKTNVTLYTLYRKYNWIKRNLAALLDKDVVEVEPEDLVFGDAPGEPPFDTLT